MERKEKVVINMDSIVEAVAFINPKAVDSHEYLMLITTGMMLSDYVKELYKKEVTLSEAQTACEGVIKESYKKEAIKRAVEKEDLWMAEAFIRYHLSMILIALFKYHPTKKVNNNKEDDEEETGGKA